MWTRYGSQDTHTLLYAICQCLQLYLYMIYVHHMSYADVFGYIYYIVHFIYMPSVKI